MVAERIGWEYSIRILRDRVSELRPVYLPPDPASRTIYEPGELAQFDFWFPPIELPVGFGQTRTAKQLPVMTMVSGYSRTAGGAADPDAGRPRTCSRAGGTCSSSSARCPSCWSGTARARSAAVGPGSPQLTLDCQAFRGVLGVKVYVCKPADPEAKGMLERFHDYLETSFLPGRSFASPADFNTQLAGFVTKANARRMRTLGCAPNDRVAADRAAMLALPPVPPEVGWRKSLRLPRDHYVRLDSNDYSVHPAVIGRRIEVHADLDRVWATCDGAIVADHARIWAKHQTITELEHSVAAKLLRHGRGDLLRPVPDAVTGEEIEIRSLGVYDTVLGLDELDELGVLDELDEEVG